MRTPPFPRGRTRVTNTRSARWEGNGHAARTARPAHGLGQGRGTALGDDRPDRPDVPAGDRRDPAWPDDGERHGRRRSPAPILRLPRRPRRRPDRRDLRRHRRLRRRLRVRPSGERGVPPVPGQGDVRGGGLPFHHPDEPCRPRQRGPVHAAARSSSSRRAASSRASAPSSTTPSVAWSGHGILRS
jgi:hypothetical protein